MASLPYCSGQNSDSSVVDFGVGSLGSDLLDHLVVVGSVPLGLVEFPYYPYLGASHFDLEFGFVQAFHLVVVDSCCWLKIKGGSSSKKNKTYAFGFGPFRAGFENSVVDMAFFVVDLVDLLWFQHKLFDFYDTTFPFYQLRVRGQQGER